MSAAPEKGNSPPALYHLCERQFSRNPSQDIAKPPRRKRAQDLDLQAVLEIAAVIALAIDARNRESSAWPHALTEQYEKP